MRTCWYLSSCVETDSTAPLTYTKSRSAFSTEERYRQTVMTINTIRCLQPEAMIYVVDGSTDVTAIRTGLESIFSHCRVVASKDLATAEDFDRIRRHPNKSLGESIQLRDFVTAYQDELRQYDLVFKMSGRYVLTDTNPQTLRPARRDAYLFKRPLQFPWQDAWGYHPVDLRQTEGHTFLKQYCSVWYGYGQDRVEDMRQLYCGLVGLLQHPSMIRYDVETLLYYLLADVRSQVMELPVTVLGWTGPDAQLMRY